MFIDDLIEQLKKIRHDKGNIRIGTLGSYGEFHDVLKDDISVRKNDFFMGDDVAMGETITVIL